MKKYVLFVRGTQDKNPNAGNGSAEFLDRDGYPAKLHHPDWPFDGKEGRMGIGVREQRTGYTQWPEREVTEAMRGRDDVYVHVRPKE